MAFEITSRICKFRSASLSEATASMGCLTACAVEVRRSPLCSFGRYTDVTGKNLVSKEEALRNRHGALRNPERVDERGRDGGGVGSVVVEELVFELVKDGTSEIGGGAERDSFGGVLGRLHGVAYLKANMS